MFCVELLLLLRDVRVRIIQSDTGWTTEESGLDSRQGQDNFLLSPGFRPVLGPTEPPSQCIRGYLR
jgi:hypothetical protein